MWSFAVVEEVFVDLVGEDEQVVLDGKLGDGLKLGAAEDLAGRIGRRVENHAAGARCDRCAKAIEIERPVRRSEWNDGRLHAL